MAIVHFSHYMEPDSDIAERCLKILNAHRHEVRFSSGFRTKDWAANYREKIDIADACIVLPSKQNEISLREYDEISHFIKRGEAAAMFVRPTFEIVPLAIRTRINKFSDRAGIDKIRIGPIKNVAPIMRDGLPYFRFPDAPEHFLITQHFQDAFGDLQERKVRIFE